MILGNSEVIPKMKHSFFLLSAAVVFTGVAGAQATRTWVSGVGDDANPCSRTAPCKTFAGAISKTAPAGEIDVLDPGGFGAVTITKSISIINEGVGEGGILTGAGNGVNVNAGPNDVVTLRGLTFEGVNTSGTGVRFNSGAGLIIDQCKIFEFNGSATPTGSAIDFEPSAAAFLNITDTQIYNNGIAAAATPAAILIRPLAGGSVTGGFSRVTITNNFGDGIKVDGSVASAGAVTLTISNSLISGNSSMGVQVIGPGPSALNVAVSSSTVSNHSGFGLRAQQAGSTISIGGNTITGNGTGIATAGGAFMVSFGNNNLGGNGTDGTPTSTPGTH